MFFSLKKEKNKRLPNIHIRNNLKSNTSINKYTPKAISKKELFQKYINHSKIYPNVTIMDNFIKKHSRLRFYLNFKRNNSMLNINNKNRFKDFEKIKIFKGNAVEVPNRRELYKDKKNITKLSKEFNKRNIYLFKKDFNFKCKMDKNETFNLTIYKPKETLKQIIINSANNQINMERNEYKHPRMVNILKENIMLYDEVFYHPWKYPNLFVK